MAAKLGKQRTAEYRQRKEDFRRLEFGCTLADYDLFSQCANASDLSKSQMFSKILHNYVTGNDSIQPVQDVTGNNNIQPDQSVTSNDDAINLGMPTADRNAFALELLQQHGGDKKQVMMELKAKLQEQYPGFSADRNKNRTGAYADPMKFYSAVSDFLGRHIKDS